MTRACQAIQMLDILKTNDIVSKDELAFRLNTSKRNITELRKEIEKAGYEIEVKLSQPAGYRLIKDSKASVKENSEYIKIVHDYVCQMPIFPKQKECLQSLEKYIQQKTYKSLIDVNQTTYRKPKTIKKYMDMLYDAIVKGQKVNICFLNDEGIEETICFMPYHFIVEKDIWYCLGKAHQHSDIVIRKILIANIMKMESIPEFFNASEILKQERTPNLYYHLNLTLKDRWDLFNIQMGISYHTKRLNEHEFHCSFNLLDYNDAKQVIESLKKDLVSYSIEEWNI